MLSICDFNQCLSLHSHYRIRCGHSWMHSCVSVDIKDIISQGKLQKRHGVKIEQYEAVISPIRTVYIWPFFHLATFHFHCTFFNWSSHSKPFWILSFFLRHRNKYYFFVNSVSSYVLAFGLRQGHNSNIQKYSNYQSSLKSVAPHTTLNKCGVYKAY